MNISEALGWMKTLKARHGELVALRNQNSTTTRTRYGKDDPTEVITPTYNAVHLDRRITLLAREMRLLDEAIKRSNAMTIIGGFTRDENVLGELEA